MQYHAHSTILPICFGNGIDLAFLLILSLNFHHKTLTYSHHSAGKGSSHRRRNHPSGHILSYEFDKILRPGLCQESLVPGYSAIILDDIAGDYRQVRILSQNVQDVFLDKCAGADMHDSISEGDEEFIRPVGV